MYTKLSSVIVRRHIVKIAMDIGDPISHTQANIADATLRKNNWHPTEEDLDLAARDAEYLNRGAGKGIQLLNEVTGDKFTPLKVMAAGVDAIDEFKKHNPQYDPVNIYDNNKAARESAASIQDTVTMKDIKKLLANQVEHGAQNPGALGLLGTGLLGLAGHRKLTRGRIF